MRLRMPSPATWVKIHATLACVWALLMIPSLLYWKESLVWVIAMSCYANFAGSMASLQAAKGDANSPTSEDVEKVNARLVELLRRVPPPD